MMCVKALVRVSGDRIPPIGPPARPSPKAALNCGRIEARGWALGALGRDYRPAAYASSGLTWMSPTQSVLHGSSVPPILACARAGAVVEAEDV